MLYIKYHDTMGMTVALVNEEYGIAFCDGLVYFTSGDKDYTINVNQVFEIGKA